MARNRKKEYIKKLLQVTTNNGYKIDVANYLYNPSHSYEYPTLTKTLEETPETITQSEIIFFKYYGGDAEYIQEVKTFPNNNDTWNIASNIEKKVIKTAKRFSLNELIKIAEAVG